MSSIYKSMSLLTHRLSTPRMLVVCAFHSLQARFKAVPVLEDLGRGGNQVGEKRQALREQPFPVQIKPQLLN
jgi:hypothetical protein